MDDVHDGLVVKIENEDKEINPMTSDGAQHNTRIFVHPQITLSKNENCSFCSWYNGMLFYVLLLNVRRRVYAFI